MVWSKLKSIGVGQTNFDMAIMFFVVFYLDFVDLWKLFSDYFSGSKQKWKEKSGEKKAERTPTRSIGYIAQMQIQYSIFGFQIVCLLFYIFRKNTKKKKWKEH